MYTPTSAPAPTPTPTPTPTPEQTAATDTFRTGAHLVMQAGAGTGKTTTLAMLAHTARRQGRLGAISRSTGPSPATPREDSPPTSRAGPPTPSRTPRSAGTTRRG